MIGQKGFFKTSKSNLNSGSNGNLDGAIISSAPSTPTPPPSAPATPDTSASGFAAPAPSQADSSPRPAKRFNPVLLVVISVLSTAAVGVLVYFLFLAPRSSENNVVYKISTETVSVQTSDEMIESYDQQIAQAQTAEDALEAKLDKVTFETMDERYADALGILNTIDVKSLSDAEQYRVYNHYTSIYQYLKDYTNAEKYQKLAQDVIDRTYGNSEDAE